jgi:hypothetical protein
LADISSRIRIIMKQLHAILFVLALPMAFSQGVTKSNSIYFEIGGSGGLGSLNFEKNFLQKENLALTWSAGFSLAPIDKNNGTGIVFPVLLHAMVGKQAHKAEFGLGQGITITTKGRFFALGTPVVGYRFQPESKSVFYRVSYTPLDLLSL